MLLSVSVIVSDIGELALNKHDGDISPSASAHPRALGNVIAFCTVYLYENV